MNSMSIFTDPVVTCPYDKFHRISLSRIQAHIVKCEKRFPPDYKKTCPYNATHRLFEEELHDHVQTCPQRRLLMPEMNGSIRNHGSLMTEFIAQSDIESTLDHGESWDLGSQATPSIDGRSTSETCDGVQNLPHGSASSNFKRVIDPSVSLRAPRGYSEAMMMEAESDKGEISDLESVVSVMCLGRGRANPNHIQQYRMGFGRGRSMTSNK